MNRSWGFRIRSGFAESLPALPTQVAATLLIASEESAPHVYEAFAEDAQTYPAPHALVAMAAAQLLESTGMQRRLLCFHVFALTRQRYPIPSIELDRAEQETQAAKSFPGKCGEPEIGGHDALVPEIGGWFDLRVEDLVNTAYPVGDGDSKTTTSTLESVAELAKAEGLDPLSLIIGVDLAEELFIAHRYGETRTSNRGVSG